MVLSPVMLEPNVSYGQIVDGCEIFISPKDWQRSKAELPKLAENKPTGYLITMCKGRMELELIFDHYLTAVFD